MSASREKKLRHDSAITKNTQDLRNREDEKKDRNFYIKCVVVVVVLAIAFIACFLYSNETVRKGMTAVTVAGEKYSAAEVDYYYYSSIEQAGSYLTYLGVDVRQDLDAQAYDETQSWGDFFRGQAVSALRQTASMYKEAVDNGYELSEAGREAIDSYSSTIDEYCETNGMTREEFLQTNYGSRMTNDIFMKHLTMRYTASEYEAHYRDTHVFTDEEIEAYYNDNKQDVDLASYELLTVNADFTNVEGVTEETTEYTDEQISQAMDAAEATANGFLDRVNSGETLADIAQEYGERYYSNRTDVSYSSFTDYAYNEWVFNENRTPGEPSMVQDTEHGCWYVIVMGERSRPDYPTVNVRHILIKPVDSGLNAGDEGYEEAEELNRAYAENKAKELLAEYNNGEKSEDAFAELAKKNSADGNASEGGLYTQVYKGMMEDSFEDWCFDPARRSGDTGIVETSYGYHVMYYAGEDLPYWKVRSINAMFTQWQNDVYESGGVKTSMFGLKAVG